MEHHTRRFPDDDRNQIGVAFPGNRTPTRPGTPNTDLGRHHFNNSAEFSSPGHANSAANPFSTPEISRPASSTGSDSVLGNRMHEQTRRYFHSRRIDKNATEKPWVGKPDPKEKWVTLLPLFGIALGLVISGVLIWEGLSTVVQHKYCAQLDTDFSEGLDPGIWTQEVSMGGFGNGEFEMTTANGKNVLIENGHLIIRATPQDPKLVNADATIDLLHNQADIALFGKCSSTAFHDCVAASNITAGNATIVPPVTSGRIHTKNARNGLGHIKYGRIEVTAKLPVGKWLWPAIWMLPVNDTYGPWPQSGEIDIAESRGNDWQYPQGGNDIMSSALHWGPNTLNDGWYNTNNKRKALHTTYSDGFNVFGLEWSQKYIFTYVNSRLLQVLYTTFSQTLWDRGNFPSLLPNGTEIVNPWANDTNSQAPFDQPFYLILDLAVGGTNGWFQDGVDGKPWAGDSANAPKDFWQDQKNWLPTWTQPQLEVSSVKIWQQCDGNEDL